VERLNQIIELANLHNKVLGFSLIPNQQPTYEPMLLTPSVLQKGASGLYTETTEETVEETADTPPNGFSEEFPDFGDSDDKLEDAVFAIKPFLFPAVRMCPFVAKGLCKHAGFNKQRALSTHCRMKHRDENGNPIIFTTVEVDPLEDGTAKIPCRWKCDRFFASYHAANDHSKKANTHCEKSEANIYPRPCPWSEVPGTECVYPLLTWVRAESSHCTYLMYEDVLANTSQIPIQDQTIFARATFLPKPRDHTKRRNPVSRSIALVCVTLSSSSACQCDQKELVSVCLHGDTDQNMKEHHTTSKPIATYGFFPKLVLDVSTLHRRD
jgi:hypothetical protein